MLSLNMHHGKRSQSHYWIFTDSSHDSNRNAHCQFIKASGGKRGQTEGTGSGVCQQRVRMSWHCLSQTGSNVDQRTTGKSRYRLHQNVLLQENIWWWIAEDSWRGDCRQLLTKRGTWPCAPKGALKRPPGSKRKRLHRQGPYRTWESPPLLKT